MATQVSDFGLAANVRNTGSVQSSQTGIGTLHWSAPEVFARHYRQRPESDIWSLGMIIYEVLARQVPYDGLTIPQLMSALLNEKELPDVALIEEGASEGLRKLLEACCQFDPDKRPTAQVVVRDIAAIQKATKQTRKAVPRSMQHHDEVLRLLAEFAKLKEDHQRLAQEFTGLAAAMDDLRQDLHSDLASYANSVADAPEPIDFSRYRNEIKTPGLVDSIEKDYNAMQLPAFENSVAAEAETT